MNLLNLHRSLESKMSDRVKCDLAAALQRYIDDDIEGCTCQQGYICRECQAVAAIAEYRHGQDLPSFSLDDDDGYIDVPADELEDVGVLSFTYRKAPR